MPTAAPRPCLAPGCPRLVTAGQPCPDHPRRAWTRQARPSAARRGYDRRWRTVREVAIAQAPPLCAVCGRAFPLELDHVVPLRLGGTTDQENIQWLCRRHHHAKTARQRRLA